MSPFWTEMDTFVRVHCNSSPQAGTRTSAKIPGHNFLRCPSPVVKQGTGKTTTDNSRPEVPVRGIKGLRGTAQSEEGRKGRFRHPAGSIPDSAVQSAVWQKLRVESLTYVTCWRWLKEACAVSRITDTISC
ncbi:Cilia- And Flagella-Associated Protein 46 [Manis pentadactyla]|nr:Cilia- And Flagella-Associated Protein 46 [Manis pentadactyla]